MNDIREWAIMLCSVSVGSAFVVFLIPDGNLNKSVNFVVSLSLLSIVIIPVCGKETVSIDLPDISVYKLPDAEEYQFKYSQFLIQHSENVVKNQVYEILDKICTEEYSVEVNVYTDTAGNIVISEIYIFLSQNDSMNSETVISDVKKHTGIIPQVVIDN